MKHLRHLALCLLLTLSLMTSAFAAEVPDSFVTQNLNGQQQLVKTYTLSPEIDPEILKEPSFEYDGFLYTWAYTTKSENPFMETKEAVQTITVETSKNDLALILEQLEPSMDYNEDGFQGELALDHTSLVTEASSYTTKYSKTTETKVIGNLDRNDMSYVPATTVKNGRTLSLANVDWQVTGTALVGEALVPSQYQAVATYSASNSYKAATGYVTTAEYRGTVSAEGIEDITYTVVYTGETIRPEAPAWVLYLQENPYLGFLLLLPALALAVLLAVLLLRRRKNVYVYIPGDKPRDYKLVAKYRVDEKDPSIDITELDPYPDGNVAIEVKRPLAKKLVGAEFTVHCKDGDYAYPIRQDKPGDWHEFNVETLSEVQS